MFAKLLKQEWKATWGILGVLSLCALGAGVVGALLLRILMNAAKANQMEPVTLVLPMLLVFVVLGLVVYSVGGGILLLHRFYKNKFTDEGYLTFTLPVRGWQIFLASLVNILVWMLFIGLVVCVSVGIIVIFGMWEILEETDILEELGYMIGMVDGEVILSWAVGMVNFVSGIVMVMCCVTLGAVVAKKHKLLAAVGIYYGVSLARNIVNTAVLTSALRSSQTFQDVMSMSSLCSAGIGLLFGVGGYFLSVYLMDHKLNLP